MGNKKRKSLKLRFGEWGGRSDDDEMLGEKMEDWERGGFCEGKDGDGEMNGRGKGKRESFGLRNGGRWWWW